MKKVTVLLNTEALASSGQWQTYDYPRRNKEAVYHTDSGRICGHHGRSQRHHAESF